MVLFVLYFERKNKKKKKRKKRERERGKKKKVIQKIEPRKELLNIIVFFFPLY